MKSQICTERIIAIRKKRGLTQGEAAELIGVTQPAYQRYEAGTRTPSFPVVKEMAHAFNTSVEYLTGKSLQTDPDYVIVSSAESPLLYSVVRKCQNFDDEQLGRLLEYTPQLHNAPLEHCYACLGTADRSRAKWKVLRTMRCAARTLGRS